VTAPNLWQRAAANTPEPPNAQACWLVRGVADRCGYMRLSCRLPGVRHPRLVSVHRNALEVLLGRPLRPDEHGDHRCKTPGCWNPDHQEVVAPGENLARRWDAAGGPWSLPEPAPDALQLLADRAWGARRVGKRCPF